ncbi:hypothetical protein APSETT444_006039 [Aspergillus pseudonomiae]
MTVAAMEKQKSLPIDRVDAETWNRDLMDAFRQALEKDPAADLLSVVGTRYISAHRVSQFTGLSEASRLNFKTVYCVQDQAKPKEEDKSPPMQQPEPPRDWLRERLEAVNTASIIYPLSAQALALANQHLAADDSSETPHGLILLGNIGAMFMSYVPGIALHQVWSRLSHEGKLSIQKQLDDTFSRLRRLHQEDGTELGGLRGEGVKDYRIMETLAYKGITTARGFDELQFSARHRASPPYVKLLRSFLDEDNKSLEDPGNADFYMVTGVIDWEDGGFYPEYYESTKLSNAQGIMSDDDLYLYAPHCISPLRFPVRWLVDRLWGTLLWSWRN